MLIKGDIKEHQVLLLITDTNQRFTAIVSEFTHPADQVRIEVLNVFMADEWILTFTTQDPSTSMQGYITRNREIPEGDRTPKQHWLRAILPFPEGLGPL